MQVFHSKSTQILSVVIAVAMLLALASIFATDGVEGLIRSAAPVGLVIFVALMLFWFPNVSVSEHQVVIRNVIRSHFIPMEKIVRIDTKWALTLYLESGSKVTSWSATAPGRHSSIFASRDQGDYLPESTYLAGTVRPGDLVTSDSGAAAAQVRRYWEQRSDSTDQAVVTRWHLGQLIIVSALLGFSFLSLQ